MFGFQVRTRQNATASPKSAALTGSPNAMVGEIDTRAPFQSVRAAVNLFGEASPRSDRSVLKKSKTIEERVLEKETQLHWTLKELDKFKEIVKSAEYTKGQALRELERANKTIMELTNKLETISEAKQEAIEATEAAKARAQQVEELKSNKISDDSWKEDVDNERKQYKTSANELNSTKQQLTNLKQDFDKALAAKLAAFQQSADGQHSAKVNREKLTELSKEVNDMRETLQRVELTSTNAEQDHVKLMQDKEMELESKMKVKEEIDFKIQSLRKEAEEDTHPQIIGQKLEETTEAIKVLEEQLKEVRAADMEFLVNAKTELDEAQSRLEEIKEEEASLREVVESLKKELEDVRNDISISKKDDSKRDMLQAELDRVKAELEEVTEQETKATDGVKELELKIQETLKMDKMAKNEEEDMRGEVENLWREAECAQIAIKEAELKLEVAEREVEEAKAAEELANDQMHKRSGKKESSFDFSDTDNKIRLTTEEFEALSRKAEEAKCAADVKVATAMAQVEIIKEKEKETIEKMEKSMEETEKMEAAINEALKMVEMADAAKQALENELRKRRDEDDVAQSPPI